MLFIFLLLFPNEGGIKMLQVNHERVAKLLQGLAAFTDSEEGVTRLAYSPLDKKAQSWLLEQVQDLHLQIRTDAVGNVFLRRDGTVSYTHLTLPTIRLV